MVRFGDALVEAIELAERWAMFDPDPTTRGEVDALVDAGDPALIRLFGGRIAFGTAGLRASVGPGPTQMNALVVRQTTVGVVEWLLDSGVAAPRVLIGFDARHHSEQFAQHAAAAVRARNGEALLADAPAPTPVFAHAALAEQADATIVITASHNPAADNGYKLYLGDGLQLVDPADAEIARQIDAVASSWHHFAVGVDDAFAEGQAALQPTDAWIRDHRSSACAAVIALEDRGEGAAAAGAGVRTVYTAMHGVGGKPTVDAFEQAGFVAPLVVPEQFEPDPAFPTTAFPNPEEPGALDLALALAHETSADLVLAHDPDADRLAIAVPDRSGGHFVALSGNDLGVLLADHVLNCTSGADRLVARSVVSTRQLDAQAAKAGVACHVSLTGFKWVARPMITHPDRRFVFGFEEAIGYCVGNHVRDKDGITAALAATQMIGRLAATGHTVWDRLDEIAAQVGLFANEPVTVRFDDDPARIDELMARIELNPPPLLAGSPIAQAGPVGLGSLPPTAGLHLLADDDTQVIIRPSGTEPKLKAYAEVIEAVTNGDVAAARLRAAARLSEVVVEVEQLLR